MAEGILAGRFDLAALGRDPTTHVAIDPGGVILWHNQAWSDFALANGGADLPARFGPGASYVGAIPDVLRPFFEDAFAEALSTGTPFEHDYECSSAEVLRRFRLRALPVQGHGLLLEHALRVEHPHDGPGEAPDPARYVTPKGFVMQCAHCRRVKRSGEASWDWVPAWVQAPPVRTSHGICQGCLGHYWRRPREKKP